MGKRLSVAAKIVFRTIATFQRNQGSLMAAGLAYFMLISASPLLVLAIAIVGSILGRDTAQQAVRVKFAEILGPDAAEAASLLVRDVNLFSGSFTASVIAIVVLIYGSTRTFAALQRSFDIIWEIPQSKTISRGILRLVRSRLLAFLMVVFLGLVMLAATFVETLGPSTVALLQKFSRIDASFGSAVSGLLILLLRTAALAAIYRTLPTWRISWKDTWPGALMAVVLLSFGHNLIGFYVATSGIRSAFGAAGALIVMLISFYFVALVVLLGAQFSKIWAQHRAGSQPLDSA